MNYNLIRILLIFVLAGLFSCEKPEGKGGNSSISGNVKVRVFDRQFQVLQDEYPAADEEVFIIYGDNNYYSDDINTSYNGVFRFEYLTKGDYSLFVYSEDSTLNSLTKTKVEKKISIKSDKDDIDAGEFVIYKTWDVNDGNAIIKGYVFDVFHFSGIPYDTTVALEQDVYLFYQDDEFYSERIRVQDGGSFVFPDLIKGRYNITVYSKNPSGGDKIPITKTVTIDDLNETVSAGNFYLYDD